MMKVDSRDLHIIACYFKQECRRRGYSGPVALSLPRLVEIHMPICELIAKQAIYKQMNNRGENQQ